MAGVYLATTISNLSISRRCSPFPSDLFEVSLYSTANTPTFHPFPNLPFELHLKIYRLTLTTRYIHYNSTLATRSHLALDSAIPPLLHVSHESRAFALEHYKLYTIGARQLYLHPLLDFILWIRYSGSSSSSRAFRSDARRLLQETEHVALEIPNLAISVKFWNRIVRKEIYRDLYERIRDGRVQRLSVVDDVYGPLECERARGVKVALKKWRKKVVGRGKELWKMWNEQAGLDNGGEREGTLPVIDFKRVMFVLKNRDCWDCW
jgi:hypothetical protein